MKNTYRSLSLIEDKFGIIYFNLHLNGKRIAIIRAGAQDLLSFSAALVKKIKIAMDFHYADLDRGQFKVSRVLFDSDSGDSVIVFDSGCPSVGTVDLMLNKTTMFCTFANKANGFEGADQEAFCTNSVCGSLDAIDDGFGLVYAALVDASNDDPIGIIRTTDESIGMFDHELKAKVLTALTRYGELTFGVTKEFECAGVEHNNQTQRSSLVCKSNSGVQITAYLEVLNAF